MKKNRDLTDERWARIQPWLPLPKKRGRPCTDDRQVLNGILHVLRTGIPWNDLPKRYGDDLTCHRRLAALGSRWQVGTDLAGLLDHAR
ncbi:MAG: transposase [Methylohalobius sp.]